MLEERLSSAYSQHTLSYGPVPGAAQYPNIYPSMPTTATESKPGAENFYYGNAAAENPGGAPSPYSQPQLGRDGGAMSPSAHSQPPQAMTPNLQWNQTPHPVISPQPNPDAAYGNSTPYAGSGAPSQFYTAPTIQQAEQHFQQPGQREVDSPYQPSPVTRRDSYYQPTAPLNPTEQLPAVEHGPGHAPSTDSRPPQPSGSQSISQPQPTDPSSQSYYLPPQQQQQQQPQHHQQQNPQVGGYQGYPSQNMSYQVPYGGDVSPISTHQSTHYQQPAPSRPVVEESLIEL